MVRQISDVRMARSFIGNATASTTETVELDFDVGVREAIRIYGCYGNINVGSGVDPALAETGGRLWEHSLHLEDGALDTPNSASASADQFDSDSEIIFHQYAFMQLYGVAANGTGGLGFNVSPNGMVLYPEPIISVVNPTHRVANDEEDAGYELFIQYDYVELNDSEVALAFARRRR